MATLYLALSSIDIMTHVCHVSTYFGAQSILDLANNVSWAWHTKATMWAIGGNPKSWAHFAALPFPNPRVLFCSVHPRVTPGVLEVKIQGGLGDTQKVCWKHSSWFQF